ncbi:hypothetical protein GOBAR_DD01402 [Gossypium barbadense]|nr:hypothetical protein GOBAR_DD01402 [Gossypium barbadense]
MLGVCTPDMQFVYVLPSWEGSVADGRVLRDAISRRHGLKVPHVMSVFHNQMILPKILEEPKGNEFQKKMLHWFPVWSTCTMLEPLMQIRDSKLAKPNIQSRIRILKRDWSIVYDMLNGKNNSSFGWDEHRQLVVAEDAAWNSYINSHKEAG